MSRPGRPLRGFVIAATFGLITMIAWAGHEVPVYPSYYPHEIAIETMASPAAATLLSDSKIHAYVGHEPPFGTRVPVSVRFVETLGAFVLASVNPASSAAATAASRCDVIRAAAGGLTGGEGFVYHPYPVTPFHGDYLLHADLAAAAKARFAPAQDVDVPANRWKVRTSAALTAHVRPEWRAEGAEWDAELIAVDAGDLAASASTSLNGWVGPPWMRTGWFHSKLLLADSNDDPDATRRADAAFRELVSNEQRDPVSSINLQRELVGALARGCRRVVVGYTVRQHYFTAQFSDGIENIGFDALSGFNSPIFPRTVKLKDFPWNGWLTLGIDPAPDAAWNPVAGFNDPFGRLLWAMIGDPALLPAPYDAGWMLNRIADVRSRAGP
jgi:hypothetical protein